VRELRLHSCEKRDNPRGVLPRGVQAWVMAAVALGMLIIILVAGRPEPSSPNRSPAAPPQTPNPDRLRDYQERLRALDAQAALQAQAAISSQTSSNLMQQKTT
jgi:hypothetical protein